jgi:hypothetical protein
MHLSKCSRSPKIKLLNINSVLILLAIIIQCESFRTITIFALSKTLIHAKILI